MNLPLWLLQQGPAILMTTAAAYLLVPVPRSIRPRSGREREEREFRRWSGLAILTLAITAWAEILNPAAMDGIGLIVATLLLGLYLALAGLSAYRIAGFLRPERRVWRSRAERWRAVAVATLGALLPRRK